MDGKITNATDNIDFDLNKWFEQLKKDSAMPEYETEKDPIVIRLERRISEKDRIISLLVGILDKIIAIENWPNSSPDGSRPEIIRPSKENAPETLSRASDGTNLRWVNPGGVK